MTLTPEDAQSRLRFGVPPVGADIGEIIGQWPGDETDEEVAAALAEIG